ncbi:MAG: hypothetical protein HYR97_06490 [Candidatus Melainabacteria bacterium]|nr:hypothetical protein [Candidatus Melainabacteria bacterium]
MLLNEIKNIKSTNKELRSFGVTVGIVFSILAFALWWQGKANFIYFAEVSIILVTLGLIFPAVLKPIQKIWMGFAHIIGYFMTRIILSVLFYLILTPLSLISRITGQEFLDLKIDKNTASYWIKKTELDLNEDRYEKQF